MSVLLILIAKHSRFYIDKSTRHNYSIDKKDEIIKDEVKLKCGMHSSWDRSSSHTFGPLIRMQEYRWVWDTWPLWRQTYCIGHFVSCRVLPTNSPVSNYTACCQSCCVKWNCRGSNLPRPDCKFDVLVTKYRSLLYAQQHDTDGLTCQLQPRTCSRQLPSADLDDDYHCEDQKIFSL